MNSPIIGSEVTVTLVVMAESEVIADRYYCVVRETGDDLYIQGDTLRGLKPTFDPLGRDERGVTRGMREWLRKNSTPKGRIIDV